MDRLEGVIVRLQGRTRRQGHDQIHLGFEQDMVASLAFGRIDAQLSGLAIDLDIHEDVESDRDLVGLNAVGLKRMR
jgi:hypothetical protein